MLKEWILSKTNIVKYEIYKKIFKFPEIRRNILKLKFQRKEIKYISDETRIVVYIISTTKLTSIIFCKTRDKHFISTKIILDVKSTVNHYAVKFNEFISFALESKNLSF